MSAVRAMRGSWRRIAATALSGVIAATPAGAQRGVFRSTVDSVVVDVSVRQRGESVTGLAAADFRITDNGVPQVIVDLSRETLPVDVTLVVDLSGSLTGPLVESLKRAIDAVAGRLRPTDRAGVIVFDQHIREISRLETGRLGVRPEMFGAPRGLTALNDAIAASVIVPADAARRRMAIVFTDGNDVTSFLDERDLVDAAARCDVAVFGVVVTDGTTRVPQPMKHPALLRSLADTTGGVLVVLQRDEDLGASFVRALEDFRTRYVLRYEPTRTTATGWHALTVGLTRRGAFEVRARRGYFDDTVSTAR